MEHPSALRGMAKWAVCFLLLVCCQPISVAGKEVRHTLHEVMNKRQHNLFFSEEEDPEYDLVTPTSQDASGDYLSHELQLNADVLNERRQRRHADNADAEKTFLHLSAFGEDHHMQLTRNRRMVHPQFSVNVHESDGEIRTHTVDTDCYHHGQLSGHDDSEIAMSNCEGELMGTIRRKREIYHIHPLPSSLREHDTHNPEAHTHVIHRVREKRRGEAGYNKNEEILRERVKRQFEPEGIRHRNFCPENGAITPPLSPNITLQEAMFVDLADTLVIGEYSERTSSREFGNNYVHAAIFIDQTMVEKYEGDEAFLTRYHMTMFNIINLIYQPSKTQYAVYIVLINLRIFLRQQSGLYVTQDSSRLLKNFCSFQMSINPSIGHPLRWNHAFLVTGYGLCFRSNTDCGELGRAPIEGVCIPDRECSVNREGGLNTAFVLAHELGHNLGMFHDGHPSEAYNCPNSEGFLMAPSTGDAARLWEFSPCSIRHLRRYLRNDFSACMDKGDGGPTRLSALTTKLGNSCTRPPGQIYDRNEQCRLQFRHSKNQYQAGHAFRFCDRTSYGRRDICKHLYCDNGRRDLGCFSTYTPALDGTVCGTNMVCWKYRCVPAQQMYISGQYCAPDVPGPREVVDVPGVTPRPTAPPATMPPLPIDGSWSFFSAFSRCSRTCGGGIRFRERTCSRPLPSNGGRQCPGSRRMFEICNNTPCPNGQSYRESQCRRLGTTWHESLTKPSEVPCSLWCEQRNLDGSVRRRHYTAPAVDDGTRCRVADSDNDRCIRDRCEVVGCDDIINSTARVDECGVCKGVGDTCTPWAGSIQGAWTNFAFHRIRLRGTGYSIPAGSWDISINFTIANAANILLLRNNNKTHTVYFLHGPGTAIRSGAFQFPVAGTIGAYYNYRGQPQRLVIKKSTNTPLILEVLYWPTRGRPTDIDFRWKSKIIPPSEKFQWVTTRGYGACSVTCDRGVETKKVRCHNKQTGGFVKDSKCIIAGLPKPVEQRECARAPCGFVAVLRELPATTCPPCSMHALQRECVVVSPATGEVHTAHPRICNRMERMAMTEMCTANLCETQMRNMRCGKDINAFCTFYKGMRCQEDIKLLCPTSCQSCPGR